MNALLVVYENTEKIKDHQTVREIISQINEDCENRNRQEKYPFEIEKKKYYAKIITQKGIEKIVIRKKYGIFSFILDFVDFFPILSL